MTIDETVLTLIRCCGPLSVAELGCRVRGSLRRMAGGCRVSDGQVADVVQRMIVQRLVVGIPHGTGRRYDVTLNGRLWCNRQWQNDAAKSNLA